MYTQDTLSLDKHNVQFGSMFMMLTNIRMTFISLDKHMMRTIITSIEPKLEYAALVWSVNCLYTIITGYHQHHPHHHYHHQYCAQGVISSQIGTLNFLILGKDECQFERK